MGSDPLALGVFDSGVGGLTVMRAIADRLPGERIVYLGDTARVPYGTKSPETVMRYAHGCGRILVERGIKVLVVACNTASAYAVEHLQEVFDIPVLGVVEPGARQAALTSAHGKIAVIGTPATVASGAYPASIARYRPDAEVSCAACPLFVPLAEEGWTDGPVPLQVAERYLRPLLAEGADTLVLGCTHYPLLRAVIAEVAGPGVTLIDSAASTAEVVAEVVEAQGIAAAPGEAAPQHTFLVSDSAESFRGLGARFLGCPMDAVEWVDLA